jgi:hypothetical protein
MWLWLWLLLLSGGSGDVYLVLFVLVVVSVNTIALVSRRFDVFACLSVVMAAAELALALPQWVFVVPGIERDLGLLLLLHLLLGLLHLFCCRGRLIGKISQIDLLFKGRFCHTVFGPERKKGVPVGYVCH